MNLLTHLDSNHHSSEAFLTAVQEVAGKLLAFCQASDWAGYDPYDAVNSKFFELLPVLDRRLPRLALTQLLKRSPANFRRLLMVPKTQNPKGLALFLSATLRLSKRGMADATLARELVRNIAALRSPGASYWCWGYSFPWQTRTIVVPRFAPNLVCTSFVANALIDAYEATQDAGCLEMAVSASEYILNELYWTEGSSTACYSYPIPTSRGRVHNANFLGAALLCRVYRHHGESKFLESALNVARYSASRQREDGSWYYGEHHTQKWIDNFHTGYNLCALKAIGRYAGTAEFDEHLRRGFEFYKGSFFLDNGAPKYFHDRTYPIDIHSVAQSLITLVDCSELGRDNGWLAEKTARWAISNMWDKRGFFYYRLLPLIKVKISYMRWSQAWMLMAIAVLLDFFSKAQRSFGLERVGAETRSANGGLTDQN